jgi:shikimate kinase
LSAHGVSTHLVLVGLPGAGKSTIGPGVAKQLGRAFLDLDTEIARRHGRSVPEIIRTDGEDAFRQLEHALKAELAGAEAAVIAPGGGWITREQTVRLIRPPARLVYLKVSPAEAIRRLGRSIVARPLLDGGDPQGALEGLATARKAAYETSDWAVDTETLTVQWVINTVVELVSHSHVG